MQEFPERGELKRMQREQERERRRIRDRQRRQSMTQEQRERHLARRRRNYQLRRQRAANAQVPYSPFPQLQTLESSAGEASTSDELQGLTSSTFLDYGVLSQGLNQVQETFNFGSKVLEGSSIPLETLVYKPANSPRRMRLNHIKGLARNLTHSMDDDPAVTHQLVAELIAKEDQDVSVGNFGSTPKSLRLNCVKRLARSKNSPPIETADQKDLKLPSVGIQLLGNESFIGST
ncbi:hypothetical protein GmHk_09G024445 [Glycine max]|nr:hypothetical protein GYH30_023687 [Glycine max]KAH1040949.1 hypothetical protein GYH30_023687 [Glycine max]KAH1040950.1 hypothetical protein GYH30_023687 [Glycine max]KAH1040951.1 hypothetical protein GYH30_023687 [Glycine max]KAH1231576.1 hypothetical protein GmHk_09G024445 [Glycine max]